MHVTTVAWLVTVAVLIAILAFDVVVIGRRPHEPTMRECAIAIAVYSTMAVVFGLGVWYFSGPVYMGEFFAGWLTEYSLSADNLFIFIVIMSSLRVPRQLQQYALMVGIVLALVFRGAFIALGAAVIEAFAWVFFLFGAFLLYTAIKLFLEYRAHATQDEATENALMRWVRRRFRATEEFHGTKLTVRQSELETPASAAPAPGGAPGTEPADGAHRPRARGPRFITPMLLVIIALGSTDLLFALDSIPAIYGLTQEPYLVFAATVFALMGLRQLYFLIGGLLQRLVYLSVGLSVILAFIGVKLVFHAMHHYGWDAALGLDLEVPIWLSLTVIVVTLTVTTIASLVVSRPGAARERR